MTNNDELAVIAMEIENLNADLLKVNATVDLIGKPALTKANELSKELNKAKDRFSSALADNAIAERKQRLASFSHIEVLTPPNDDRNVMAMAYTIRYTQDRYDMNLKASVPTVREVNGFASLPGEAFEYLVTCKPEAIPPAIAALAPGDPYRAFDLYAVGKRRGYIVATA